MNPKNGKKFQKFFRLGHVDRLAGDGVRDPHQPRDRAAEAERGAIEHTGGCGHTLSLFKNP